LAPANVIVPPVALVKLTVAVPAAQTAPSVEAFVQVPEMFHVSDPNVMADDALLMLTAPLIVAVPEVEVKSPPDMVSAAAVIVNVDLANVPPDTVNVLVTTVFVASVTVPAETVRAENVLSVDRRVIVAVALNSYVLVDPSVNTDPAPDVFQVPARVQTPVVTVIVPVVPPVIVTVASVTADAFAVRVPPLPTPRSGVSAELPKARSAVASAVVDEASVTDNVLNHLIPLVAIVNVWGLAADEVNVALLNSASAKFAPAKVIVPPAAAVNVTVAVPASQEAEVVAFVHVPETDQAPLPKSMNEPTAEIFTAATDPVVVLVAQAMFPPESVKVPAILMLPPFVLQLNGSWVVA
jgi:hypothetical protein